jgi:hypothetical protein
MNASSGKSQLLPVDAWMGVLRDEYLSDFVPSGGAAVKFVTGTQRELDQLVPDLKEIARGSGLLHAFLDPAQLLDADRKPDLHRPERFFFAVTKSVGWKAFAADQARSYLADLGIEVSPQRDLSDLDGIASDNGDSRDHLLGAFRRRFVNRHIRDYAMGADFRNAVAALTLQQLVPDGLTPTTEEVLLSWFRGGAVPGGAQALKRVQVYERIKTDNAWTMLRSFLHWIPSTGHRGVVVVLDFRPYEGVRVPQTRIDAQLRRVLAEAKDQGAGPDEIYRIIEDAQQQPAVLYSRHSYMRMLALLRRFIDSTAILERILLLVLSTPDYYPAQPDPPRRTYFDYDALQTRIGQEVHDVRRANPYAALVHLGAGQ